MERERGREREREREKGRERERDGREREATVLIIHTSSYLTRPQLFRPIAAAAIAREQQKVRG